MTVISGTGSLNFSRRDWEELMRARLPYTQDTVVVFGPPRVADDETVAVAYAHGTQDCPPEDWVSSPEAITQWKEQDQIRRKAQALDQILDFALLDSDVSQAQVKAILRQYSVRR